MPTTSPHLPSRVLGRYAMYEQFAAGGMATLHYGRLLGPSGFSRTVAIKRLHAHLSEDPDFVAMFLDEARLAARIHHPNVIQTLDAESSEGELFVVLDYVHGDSLSRLQREAKRVTTPASPPIVGAILFGALEGLHAAHEARDASGEPLELVHRDVSPHNILIGTDGVARVLDFGVAKARGRTQTTRVGQLKGKLAYMAPEQLGGRVTRRSDVFSASVVLWEALTGVRLFQGDDEGEVVAKLLHEPIPAPRTHAPSVTRELEAVVMRGLERDPAKRFATAREMAVALERHAALATPIEVGAWVERVAGTALAQRAARVASIDAEFGGAVASRPGVMRPPQASSATITGATVPTVAVPGLARTQGPQEEEKAAGTGEGATLVTAATTGEAVESTKTGIATVTDLHLPRRRPRLLRPASIASMAGLAAVATVAWLVRASFPASPQSPAASTASAAAAAAPASTADTDPASASPPPDAPAANSIASTATVPASPAVTADPTEPRPAAVPPPAPRRTFTPAPRHHASASCSPPYTIDARGVRHYKPECL
ncbi:MAG TPA: serine/threonine-protein kinase [Polyangiaceae bacterium]